MEKRIGIKNSENKRSEKNVAKNVKWQKIEKSPGKSLRKKLRNKSKPKRGKGWS